MIIDPLMLYEHRIILLSETAPQSNKYRQIMMTMEEFNQLGEKIASIFPSKKTDKLTFIDMRLSKEVYDLNKEMLEIRTTYTEDQLNHGRMQ